MREHLILTRMMIIRAVLFLFLPNRFSFHNQHFLPAFIRVLDSDMKEITLLSFCKLKLGVVEYIPVRTDLSATSMYTIETSSGD